MSLNLEKEHGEVFGFGRARYFQNDKYYDSKGNEVTLSKDGFELDVAGNEVKPDVELTDRGVKVADLAEEYGKLNWREIKERVIAMGGEWTNKRDGVEYLSQSLIDV